MKDDPMDAMSEKRAMQRFVNDPDDLVDETVAGFLKAHADLVRRDLMNPRVVVSRQAPQEGRVDPGPPAAVDAAREP